MAPLCLLFLFLVPDLASLVSFRFLFSLALSCLPCSSFFFRFPAVKQRGTVRLSGRVSWPVAGCAGVAQQACAPPQGERCPVCQAGLCTEGWYLNIDGEEGSEEDLAL